MAILSACGQTASAPASQSTEDQLLATMSTWAPGLTWSTPAQATNAQEIIIDDTHVIEAQRMNGMVMTAPLTQEQFGELFMGTDRNALTASLASAGWGTHPEFDADGATGTQWGYVKADAKGMRFLMISARGTECTTDPNTPVSCTAYEASAYLSDPLVAGDDI